MAHITTGSVWNAIEKDPAEARAMERKSLVLSKVQERLEAKRWTQSEAAKHLGVDQPRVSDLVQGKITKFSLDTLMSFLDRLDQPVAISFPPKARKLEDV